MLMFSCYATLEFLYKLSLLKYKVSEVTHRGKSSSNFDPFWFLFKSSILSSMETHPLSSIINVTRTPTEIKWFSQDKEPDSLPVS